MSAVDAPPGIAFAGQPAGEFIARGRSRRLAYRMFVFVTFAGVLTLVLAARRLHAPMIEFLLVAPLVCMSVAFVGFAVRSAHLRIDADGVRWGWSLAGFRMRLERIKAVNAYTDAVALSPKRGSTWYLSRRDWDDFDRVRRALRRAQIGFETHDRRAPVGAKLQSYGLVLEFLLAANAMAATFALVVVAMV
jgi:hypothetical protein